MEPQRQKKTTEDRDGTEDEDGTEDGDGTEEKVKGGNRAQPPTCASSSGSAKIALCLKESWAAGGPGSCRDTRVPAHPPSQGRD